MKKFLPQLFYQIQKFKIVALCALFLTIYSCSRFRHVERNYEYAPDCDCSVKGLLSFGGMGWYARRTSAHCNKINYFEIKDSLWALQQQMDTLDIETIQYESIALLQTNLENQWTHCNIRTKEKWITVRGEEDSIVKSKVRIRYYNNHRLLFKKMGKAKYQNGVLIRSSLD